MRGQAVEDQPNPASLSELNTMDTRTPEQRSRIMRSVRSKHTGPEMTVRRLVHSMGYRFRLHRKDLPGSPDLVLVRYRAAIFVHGCFWHGHTCKKGRLPRTRLDFWVPKIQNNQRRDAASVAVLRAQGWRVLTIWQCETGDPKSLERRIRKLLQPRRTWRAPH
jgi:DNA mismatch endonuclease (patch repair protein)